MGLSDPAEARAFRAASGWPGAVLVDAEARAYRALALGRASVWGLARPRLLREAWRARREGHRQRRSRGDPWQLGGTLVVAPPDRVLLAHRNRGPEDEATLDDVLAALRRGGA